MKKILVALLISATAQASPANEPGESIIFYIDQTPVTQNMLQAFYEMRGYKQPADELQQRQQQVKIANELINTLLLSEEATRLELEKTSQVQQAVELARKNILGKALLNRYLNEIQVSEEEIAQAYQAIQQESVNRTEYKARHVLLGSEAEARDIIKKLRQGGDFKILARQYSIESAGIQNKAQNDGDLGWLSNEVSDPVIITALAGLDIGKYSEEPVKTEFGWHVFLVEDKKKPAVPALTEVKKDLVSLVTRQKIQQKVNTLREKATIKSAADKPSTTPAID